MQKHAVLIVENHPDIQRLIQDLLELKGMGVWAASSGREALSFLEQFRPDLILCDVELSDGNAYDFLKHWREQERVKKSESISSDRNFSIKLV